MKKHLLIACIFAFSISAFSQEPGAYNIIVTNGQGEHDNYVAFLKSMIAEGFEIDEKDDLFHTVTFEPVKYDYTAWNRDRWNYLIMSASFKGDSIIMSGKNKGKGQRKLETVYNPSIPATVAAFSKMNRLASKMGGSITYSVKRNFEYTKGKHVDDVYGRSLKRK